MGNVRAGPRSGTETKGRPRGPLFTTLRRGLCIALVAVATAIPVPGASADFSSTDSSASQTLSTATLSAPSSASAVRGTCVPAVSRAVNVSWSATSSSFADGYDVLRSVVNGSGYLSVGTVAAGTTTFTDTTVLGSTTYYYVVEAKLQSWRSSNSPQASVTTPNAITCL